jgi:hypothetical protein
MKHESRKSTEKSIKSWFFEKKIKAIAKLTLKRYIQITIIRNKREDINIEHMELKR